MIKLNLKAGGVLSVTASDIIEYKPSFKGSTVIYSDGDEQKTVEVYEAVIRIKAMMKGVGDE